MTDRGLSHGQQHRQIRRPVDGGGVAAFQAPLGGVKAAPPRAEIRRGVLQRHLQQRQKGAVIAEGHTGVQPIAPPQPAAQSTVDAPILLVFAHFDLRLIEPYIAEHLGNTPGPRCDYR